MSFLILGIGWLATLPTIRPLHSKLRGGNPAGNSPGDNMLEENKRLKEPTIKYVALGGTGLILAFGYVTYWNPMLKKRDMGREVKT